MRDFLLACTFWAGLLGPVFGQFGSNPFSPGDAAPSFEIRDLAGEPVSLVDLRGQVVVLNFWFIACPPCISEMPELNRLVRYFSDRPVTFLGLARDSVRELREFLEEHEFLYRVIPEATAIAERYGIRGAPTHILIDREGRFRKFTFGAVTDLEGELMGPIEELLGPEN